MREISSLKYYRLRIACGILLPKNRRCQLWDCLYSNPPQSIIREAGTGRKISMKRILMSKGARTIVEVCAGVKAGITYDFFRTFCLD